MLPHDDEEAVSIDAVAAVAPLIDSEEASIVDADTAVPIASKDADAVHGNTESDAPLLHTQLAALAADPAALCCEIERCIGDGESDDAKQLQLQTVVGFLQRSDSSSARVTEQVATGLIQSVEAAYDTLDSNEAAPSETTILLLLLLDELLRDVVQHAAAHCNDKYDALLAYVRLATRRLRSDALEEQERAMFLQWCDLVLERVIANASTSQSPLTGTSDAAERDDSAGSLAVAVAAALLALHDAVAERVTDPTAVNFKVATLVWKNLTKLSSSFRDALASGSTAVSSTRFEVDDMLASVIAAMEQCAQQLRHSQAAQQQVAATLKYVRLYWRAFQGQLLCFASALTSELEASVMALVHVASSLVAVVSRNIQTDPIATRLQTEAAKLLGMVLALVARLGSDVVSVSAAAREHMRGLLWHAPADMTRAIRQRRGLSTEPDDTVAGPSADADDADAMPLDVAIALGHVLAVASFSAHDANVLPASASSTELGSANVLAAATMLLDRLDASARIVPLRWLETPTTLFVDALLVLLCRVADARALQLFLFEQTLVASSFTRQRVLADLWTEWLGHGWCAPQAAAALDVLLAVATSDRVAPNAQRNALELLAAVFSTLSAPQQQQCVGAMTSAIDTLFADGPTHAFSARVASQLQLLETLATASWLRCLQDVGAKERWVGTYLPMALECCGTVLDMLTATGNGGSAGSVATSSLADRDAMLRILDVGLLVVKSVVADDSDLAELASMLVPMCSEILTQLAISFEQHAAAAVAASRTGVARTKTTRSTAGVVDPRLMRRVRCRVLESATNVLAALGDTLKQNASSQCALAIRDLARVVTNASPTIASSCAAAAATFVSTTLFDVQAATNDAAVANRLFMQLFQTLTTTTTTTNSSASATPLHVAVALHAFYRFAAHSNVVAMMPPGCNLLHMLHTSEHARFRELLALKRLPPASVARAIQTELMSAKGSARIPNSTSSNTGNSDVTERAGKRAANDDARHNEPLTSKRRKFNAFVALCRRAHDAFVAPPEAASASFVQAVAESELDEAAHVLEQLLMQHALA